MSEELVERLGKENIIQAMNESNSFAELCQKLNAGYRYVVLALSKLNYLNEFKLKIKNYKQLHTKDNFKNSLKFKYFDEQTKTYKIDPKKWCELFFKGELITTHVSSIKKYLIAAGFKENKCECCGILLWQGKEISLQIHHIDGNKRNNELSNLQLLCPNCHSQTENFGSKNKIKLFHSK